MRYPPSFCAAPTASPVLAGERAQASAPPDVSGTLRVTAQAEADALRQSADAEVQHDETGAASARTLARQLAAERQRLEAGSIRYETWTAGTRDIRAAADKARAELQRRGHAQPEEERQAQPDEPLSIQLERMWHPAHPAALSAASSIH